MLIRPWRIEMLGGFRAQRENQTVDRFRSQKAALLLAYLATYPGRKHSREQLADLLWPEDDMEAARNRLRVSLSALRHQLELPGESSGTVLMTDRLSIMLRPQAFTSDVAEFDTAFSDGLHTADAEERSRLLRLAVDTYRGEFLPQFYDEWVLVERQRLTHALEEALRQLVSDCLEQQDFLGGLDFARRAVLCDPYNESAVRDLMLLNARLGKTAQALQEYEALRQRLAEALNVPPNLATRKLAEQIAQCPEPEMAGRATPRSRWPRECAPSAPPFTAERPPGGLSAGETAPLRGLSKSLEGRLPIPLTQFYGRAEELAQIEAMLSNRIVTLTGPGGAGKTRLSVEAARRLQGRYKSRVWFVPLADLRDPAQLAAAIADVVAPTARGAEQRDPLEKIVAALRPHASLLILDNLEHIASDAAELVTLLLDQLPALTCLATSRRSLGIAGEREFVVPPLPVPLQEDTSGSTYRNAASQAGLAALLEVPSVALFVDRAQAVLPYFQITPANAADIAALCRALEGIPLALELAAARARVLTPRQMLPHIERGYALLVDSRAGKDNRHRSMQAVIEWSFQLLLPSTRHVLGLLSVFRGGWTLEAAETVCDDANVLDALEQLRIDSLVQCSDIGPEMRYRMFDAVREFAGRQVSQDALHAAQARHAACFAHLAQTAEPTLRGPQQALGFHRLQTELDNLRAAFDFCIEDPDSRRQALLFTRSLWRFWMARGSLGEGYTRALAAVRSADAQAEGAVYVDALNATGALASARDDYAVARNLLQEAVDLAREGDYPPGLAAALDQLGVVETQCGRYPDAHLLLEESLEIRRRTGNDLDIAETLRHLGIIAAKTDDFPQARRLYEESIVLQRRLRDRQELAVTLRALGLIADRQGDYASAQALFRESGGIHQEMGDRISAAMAYGNLGILACKQKDYTGGRAHFTEAIALFRELGMRRAVAIGLGNMGSVEELLGNFPASLEIHAESLEIYRELGTREGIVHALNNLGKVAARAGQNAMAHRSLEEALDLSREMGLQSEVASALEGWGLIAIGIGRPADAASLFGAADRLREILQVPLTPAERSAFETPLRAAMGEGEFTAAFSSGRETPLEAALDLARSIYR
ncbi:MAG TPA: tetratricopeptide repeat protein [Chthonomonadaceae bacterium]|nr:tetratricopeptide repeat protein [Chthonomonadaceae bacterium]